ncbi:MAG: glycerate kinase [Fidelibacterota bacterium]
MKLLLAFDSFKESINAIDLCKFLADEIHRKWPKVEILTLPVSDGGEHFLEIMMNNISMQRIELDVTGPRGNPVHAAYGIKNDTAYIEMAQAAGLQLLTATEKNPFKTTTYGLGQIIKDAINRDITNFIIGIGGSATCDGGAGMAQALGFEFYNEQDNLITDKMTGDLIGKVTKIKAPILPVLKIKVASDVNNPLLGKKGAVFTYAEQKGATKKDLPLLERNMENLSRLFQTNLCRNIKNIPGAGAAGGLGAGLIAFLDAQLVSGSKLVLDTLGFDDILKDVDQVLTGEGKFDDQSGQGKIIAEIVSRCGNKNKPVTGIFGKFEADDPSIFQDVIQLVDFGDPVNTIKYPKQYLRLAIEDLLKNLIA